MTTEALRAKERVRGTKERKAKRGRHLAWRTDFRGRQAEAKARIEALLSLQGVSRYDFDYLCMAHKNRRGPRMDQIKRVEKLWKKYDEEAERERK